MRYNLHRFQANADYFGEEAEDVLRVVGAVGVVGDAAAFVGLDAVLVDDPFEGRAVAAAVAISRPRPGTDRGRGARQAGVLRSTPDQGIIPQRDAGAASPLVDAAERPARRARRAFWPDRLCIRTRRSNTGRAHRGTLTLY